MNHKLWAVGKILQYCLWYSKYSHLKLRLKERAKCCLGIIVVCGPLEPVGHLTRASIGVLGRSRICKNGSYVKALIKSLPGGKRGFKQKTFRVNWLMSEVFFPLCQSTFCLFAYLVTPQNTYPVCLAISCTGLHFQNGHKAGHLFMRQKSL